MTERPKYIISAAKEIIPELKNPSGFMQFISDALGMIVINTNHKQKDYEPSARLLLLYVDNVVLPLMKGKDLVEAISYAVEYICENYTPAEYFAILASIMQAIFIDAVESSGDDEWQKETVQYIGLLFKFGELCAHYHQTKEAA